jgi:hypothetical protein
MASGTTLKLAVLVDADNAQSSIIKILLAEVAKHGTALVKRAYGDWTGPGLKGWSDELLKQSIQPIQQFAYTQGKNSTDSAMIIDAMDLLYSKRLDGFCLVSSDSDFTRLATRIRESGLIVYGFGEQKTPKAFIAACDKFFYTEDLIHPSESVSHSTKAEVPESYTTIQRAQQNDHLASRLQNTEEAALNNSGWARLSDVDQHLTTHHPEFKSSTHGYSKLSDLISDSSHFDIEHRPFEEGKPPEFFVRNRKASTGSTQV